MRHIEIQAARLLPSTTSILASALLLPMLLTSAAAQRPVEPAPAPGNPADLSIRDVCAPAGPREAQGNQFQWSPDGTSIAYFKPLERGFGLRLELDAVSASGTERAVLLKQQQIDQLFPAVAIGRQETKVPPPREKVAFEWGSQSSGLLLHSDTSIVWLDRKTLETHTLVTGTERVSDVQLSPDGRWAAFVREHNVWIVGIAGSAPRAITKGGDATLRKGELDWMYPAELGTKHGYAWSPDSSRIAYLEFDLRGVQSYTTPFPADGQSPQTIDYPTPGNRNPLVRVLVSGLKKKPAPVVIDTGREQDLYLPRLQWLPDGKQIAVERLNRRQTKLDLLLADAHTGASRIVLTDTDAYWINLSDILCFLKGSPRFIWSSERSGYRHLYLYGLDGKLIAQLTDGKWEVTALNAVNEAKGRLYYTSTQKSPIERQLYAAGLDGNGEMRVSHDSGTHEAVFSPDASLYVDNFSTSVKPWSRAVYRIEPEASDAGQIRATALLFALYEPSPAPTKAALRPVDFVTVKTHDGIDLNALIIRPPGFTPDKKYPVVLYIDGAPGRQAVRDAWDGDLSLWQQLLAEHGYVVFAVDNRGTAGRGHLFEEYIHLHFAGQEIVDQRDAVRFLQSLPYIDPARTGVWGRGFSGSLAVHLLRHSPQIFKAGFAVAPVIDWLRYDSAFTERYLDDRVSNQDGYLSSSELGEWGRFKGPLVIAQGAADLQVHPDQAMELQEDVVKARKYIEITLFPGQTHAIDQPDACAVLYQRAVDFFAKNL